MISRRQVVLKERYLQICEAIFTRGRRSETVNVMELPQGEAALVLREDIKEGNPFARSYGVTADSSLEEFERAVLTHPVFVLESK